MPTAHSFIQALSEYFWLQRPEAEREAAEF
jgi:hypothetical protein